MSAFESVRFNAGRSLLSEISADKLNAIVREVRKNRPRGERGITIRESGDATYIGLAASVNAASAPRPAAQPWDLSARRDPTADPEDENPPYLVTVRPGTINGVLASNWDEEFECSSTGVHYAKAVIATDGKAITGVTIDIDTIAPSEQQPQKFGIESSIEYLFGVFSGGASYNVLSQSITLLPRLRLVTSADPAAAPGQSPFDLWYELARYP
jgi:hypothetical protein